MIGEQFGDYKVIEKTSLKRGNNYLFKVQCKCGKENLCSKQDLTSGKRNRCDECGKKKRFGEQIGGISINFFHNYKRGAQKRGLDFLITYEYAAQLFEEQSGKCALSGVDLFIKGVSWKNRTASLDRIDSSKGYIEGNVQWIHKTINEMKNNQSDEQFILWCTLIANFNLK